MEPSKIAADEARRVAQHERIKGELEEDVHAKVADVARELRLFVERKSRI